MATNLSAQISALATQVGTDIKGILSSVGNLGSLTTTQKASLVVALNELKASLTDLEGKLGAQIDDAKKSLTTTWSSQKISTQITSAVNSLVDGAPGTLDTLKELAEALTQNKDAISALQALAAGHVKFDSVQSLSSEQQKQARENIGAASSVDVGTVASNVGSLSALDTGDKTSIVAALNEVKRTSEAAKTEASSSVTTANSAQQAVTALSTNVGDTQADFVKTYTTARGAI